jgi:hypothetical protein
VFAGGGSEDLSAAEVQLESVLMEREFFLAPFFEVAVKGRGAAPWLVSVGRVRGTAVFVYTSGVRVAAIMPIFYRE